MIVLKIYLTICLAIFIFGVLIGLYEDVKRGPNFKFGYNVLCNPFNSMWMTILMMLSCPIVNMLVIIWWYFSPKRRK